MVAINISDKGLFHQRLNRKLRKLEKGENLTRFADAFYAEIPISDLTNLSWDAIVPKVHSAWSFFKSYNGKRPLLRVFNPTGARDGFFQRSTIIQVAAANMPFLLESIRIELAHQNIVLTEVQQCPLNVVRGSDRKPVITAETPANEVLIHLEIETIANPLALEKPLKEVLRLVRSAVDDFTPMRRQLLLWSDELGTVTTQAQNRESFEALNWLYANNFTFLSYEEYSARGKRFSLDEKSRLGIRIRTPFEPDAATNTVNFAKLPERSTLHRPAFLDEVVIRLGKGRSARACRFIGLFTSSVYNQNPQDIPMVRRSIDAVYSQLGIVPTSHKGREVARIIEVLPRDELLMTDATDLITAVEKIYSLQERRVVRVLLRRDRNGHFVNCLVFLPRDAYDTAIRIAIQQLLEQTFGAISSEFSTFFSESTLVRTHFVLQVDAQQSLTLNSDKLEQQIENLTRTWEDKFRDVLIARRGEDGEGIFARLQGVFSPGYIDEYWPETAYDDVDFLLNGSSDTPMQVKLYEWRVNGQQEIRFKIFSFDRNLALSDVIPVLENLGARALEEHPFELRLENGWMFIHDFVLEFENPEPTAKLRHNFESAFLHTMDGSTENDDFNRLITAANLDYERVEIIRALARYLGQLQNSASQSFIANCMVSHNQVTRDLLELFALRCDPTLDRSTSQKKVAKKTSAVTAVIDAVDNLAEDRILRRFLEMINAIARTNYYQNPGTEKTYLSFKFLPHLISEMPLPRPEIEIFVYSSRFEGVHLRGGKVARGGLRWSDRTEDYRTEVLGLMRAQQVKNSVIVPVGAKGGFLPKKLPVQGTREEVMAEGIACYRMFISGLLDVTDNLVKGKVVKPNETVCHDTEDYYLVVAADKGTATFSDIANEIAISRRFWLGDAFASGGSVGYDHKAMGITARGAWISVQRHFHELGVDPQRQPITVVGIGDMSGDVFGNGMLMSEQIELVAAFNHMHIFIDPNPETKRSFKERNRLFRLSRSTWQDYNASLISAGGGVFSRNAKSVPISPEMKARFGISESTLTPNALITRLLKARVDLVWNGGIGTYVKSKLESHVEVGDKANDAIRVNGEDLQCRVVGEGGNLGLTQRGRVEFNLRGGLCFTDSIDNAGGVNCSDAEVNIKILLNQLLESSELTLKQRNELLASMTDAVSEIVLDNNYEQARAINLHYYQAHRRGFEYARVIKTLRESGHIDPRQEHLPNEEQLQERMLKRQSFTSPELAMLISHVKNALKVDLLTCPLDQPYLMNEMSRAFPPVLLKKHAARVQKHRLRREIIATQIANNMVNNMGISFVSRIGETTGASTTEIAMAYIAARDIFNLDALFDEVRTLQTRVAATTQKDVLLDLIRLVRRSTRWLLRHHRDGIDLSVEIPRLQSALSEFSDNWQNIVVGDARLDFEARRKQLTVSGLPEPLAERVAASHYLYFLLGIFDLSESTRQPVTRVAQVLFSLDDHLQLNWFSRQMNAYQAGSQWEALARESLQDDLNQQQVAITRGVLEEGKPRQSSADLVEQWEKKHQPLVNRWIAMQAEIRAATTTDLSIFTVGIRELTDLSVASSGTSTN